MRALKIIAFSYIFICLTALNASAAEPLRIDRITPDGTEVPAGRQIVLTFNRAVVPVGRMERSNAEIPITITPALNCEWRWLNTTSLACQLPETASFTVATKYRMEIKPGIMAEDGATIEAAQTHEFQTETPRARYISFYRWKSPTTPVLRAQFSLPVTLESLKKTTTLLAQGDNSDEVHIEAEPDIYEPNALVISKDERGKLALIEIPNKQASTYSPDRIARRVWLITPTRALKEDTTYMLNIRMGLRTLVGPEESRLNESTYHFNTLPPFKFVGLSCSTLDDKTLTFKAGEPIPAGACDPMQSPNLEFSSPVLQPQMHALAFTPTIKWQADAEEEQEYYYNAEEGAGNVPYALRQQHSKNKTYSINLPAGLKAGQSYEVQSRKAALPFYKRWWSQLRTLFGANEAPLEVHDAFGRTLDAPLQITFRNDHRRPNYVLPYSHAVLEQGVDSELPLYVNNLEKYRFAYRAVTAQNTSQGKNYEKTVPAVQDIQFAVPMGLREMLGGKSGAVFGHLFTTPQIRNANTKGDPLFAQVTPYNMHLKLGHFQSMLWLTDMATGQPVADADITLYRDAYTTLGMPKDIGGTAKTDAKGIAMLPGTSTVDPLLNYSSAYDREKPRLFVRAEKAGEMSLLPVDYDYYAYSQVPEGEQYVWSDMQNRYGHMRAWGTTAQGIYRAGDTIEFKLFVRDQDNNRLTAAPDMDYKLEVIDPTGKTVHQAEGLKLSEFGGYSGQFATSKEAVVGWYQFRLTAEARIPTPAGGTETIRRTFQPMQVLVSDFTVAPFKVKNQLNGDHFSAQDKVEVNTRAELHSGGSYSDATARITAILDNAHFRSTDPVAKAFSFDSFLDEMSSEQIFQTTSTVDGRGELNVDFTPGRTGIVYGTLTVESAVQDERGKFITGYSRASYTGVDRLVGLHSPQWLYPANKSSVMQAIVVDKAGKPVSGTDFKVVFEHEVNKAARVKGAGNAYLTEYHTEWEKLGECKGKSTTAAYDCAFTPPKAGSYRAVASIKDTNGTAHSTREYFYATGADTVVWNNSEDAVLPIIPEADKYKVGDTARFMIKNPYPGAKALISVERYGVLDHWVQTLDGSTPVIEFPIKPDYVPGAYLSVTVVSPRVEKPLVPVGQIDLGKPAMRMGYLNLPVSDPYKDITITAKTDQDMYKPGDEVTLTLDATPANPEPGNPPIELTVAVLDEAVLDLIAGGTNYYDPKSGMWKLDGLDLKNFSLMSKLIGRQKFEKKGANPGGDGGNDLAMRSLFKFVSYWNPALKTDKDGKAQVTFKLPDNLTGWRVLAIAATKADRFGLGQGNFKVNRPTEIRPVMPNQVIEGDSFEAGFSVMNRTDKARTLTVAITAEGAVVQDAAHAATLTKEVTLEPYKRTLVYLPLKVATLPQDAKKPKGEIRFSATAQDAMDGDGVKHSIPVNKYRALSFAATYGTTTDDHAEEAIQVPADALPDTGKISISLSPTVIGNVAGAFEYMERYPYLCWEQKLTKAVMASNFSRLKDYLPTDLKWADSAAIPQSTLDQAADFQAPNGGMAYFVPTDERVSPYLSAYTAIAFNWLRKAGYTVPEAVDAKLQAYLQNILRNDAVPDHYTDGMRATVRGVALAALAERGKVTDADIERYRPHMKAMSLLGKAFFLQAANQIEASGDARIDTAKAILAMTNQTGGKFQFSETLDDGYQQLLTSPLRENCMVLSAFSQLAKREDAESLVSDIPFKLVRFITQSRGAKTHWANTQENVFCTQALADFADQYEKDAPRMQVQTLLNAQPLDSAQFTSKRDATVTHTKPVSAADLGKKQMLSILREGAGRLYYALQLAYALPPEKDSSANAGIELKREYSVQRDGKWALLKANEHVARGELIRVDLFLSLPAARNFVVVDDPVPGGLEPVNTDLANSSQVDAKAGDYAAAGGSIWLSKDNWIGFGGQFWSFYHQEMRHDSVRYYSDYLPAGNYHLSYTAQAIATGDFSVMPSLAQEMYAPDVYGKTVGAKLAVQAPKDTAAKP